MKGCKAFFKASKFNLPPLHWLPSSLCAPGLLTREVHSSHSRIIFILLVGFVLSPPIMQELEFGPLYPIFS